MTWRIRIFLIGISAMRNQNSIVLDLNPALQVYYESDHYIKGISLSFSLSLYTYIHVCVCVCVCVSLLKCSRTE